MTLFETMTEYVEKIGEFPCNEYWSKRWRDAYNEEKKANPLGRKVMLLRADVNKKGITMENLQCCFMNGEKQCEQKAIFEIKENTRVDPDNFTHSCEDHLGKMIGTTKGYPECKSWTIELLE